MRFLFACGGTAGHVNPAVGVAGRIRELLPDSEILFIGALGKMEMELVPREGYEIRGVPVSNLSRSLSVEGIRHNIKFVSDLIKSGPACRKIIEEFKPDVVIGTGGYVCYPVLHEAAKLGIPTVVHESNAEPGLTTRQLEKCVDKIMVGFAEARENYKHPEKVVVTGTPVRGDFFTKTKEQAKEALGVNDGRPLVVSFWGSLGAGNMNRVTAELLYLEAAKEPFHHIHSVGSLGWQKMHEWVSGYGVDLRDHPSLDVREYIYDMADVMRAADLVICRAGASTLAELSCIGKPAILIPSPNVTNNHQERNARVLEHAGGAKVLLEGAFTADDLYNLVSDLLADPAQLAQMAQNMKSAGVADAAERIADLVLKLADRHGK